MPDPLAFAVDLASVRDRLKSLAHFLSVEDIQAASEILSDPDAPGFLPPAAFVSIASETAERNDLIGGHRQRVTTSLSILFAEPSARADQAADDVVEQTRKAVIRLMIGWTPTGAAGPLNYSRYLLRATGGGLVWGEVLFSTSYQLRT